MEGNNFLENYHYYAKSKLTIGITIKYLKNIKNQQFLWTIHKKQEEITTCQLFPNFQIQTLLQIPYILEYKLRILGGFYKDKVGGSAYTRVYAPSEKNYIINIHTRFFFFQIEISHVI